MWIEFKKWCSHARKNVGEKRWANGDGVGWWMGTLIPQRFEKRHQKLLSANALIIKLNFHGWEKTKNDVRILFAVNKCMVLYWTETSTNNLIGTKPILHKRITIICRCLGCFLKNQLWIHDQMQGKIWANPQRVATSFMKKLCSPREIDISLCIKHTRFSM